MQSESSTHPAENLTITSPYSKIRVRWAVSLFYFGQGICFASWASRIPDLKTTLQLSDAALGSVLLALPLGQMLTMPISGRLTAKYGSRRMLTIGAPLYALALSNIGLAASGWQLAIFLFLFGVAGNLCNIALNTHGVAVEGFYGKSIMTSFHGSWSVGGFTGALLGIPMLAFHVSPHVHFCIIAAIVLTHISINYKYLLFTPNLIAKKKTSFFTKPQGVLVQLGIIAFCSMAAEGAMFDWSGVYFKEIVKAPSALVILGYASFMVTMATGRFLGDKLINMYGRKKLLQLSGLVLSSGIFLAVIFPNIYTATLGFMLVGIGASSIVPSVYSIAGSNTKVSPGIALAMVSGVGYFGFLLAPPLIGYISAISNLRYSYALIGCFGIVISVLISKLNAIKS